MFKVNSKDTRTTPTALLITSYHFYALTCNLKNTFLKNNLSLKKKNEREDLNQLSGNFDINYPAGNYMFKVNNKNIRTRCNSHWRRSGDFIVNFQHISHLAQMFLLLTLSS